MNPEEWQQVKELFLQRVAESDPELDADIRDADIRDAAPSGDVSAVLEVRSLLSHFEKARKSCFLDKPLAKRLDSTKAIVTAAVETHTFHQPSPVSKKEHPKQIGRFEVLEPLGKGSFGTAYRARDPIADRFVAIKIPNDAGAESTDFIEEARTAADLNHTNIVTIHEVNLTDAGQPYIAMELMSGGTLKDRITLGEISWQEATEVTIAIAAGLTHGHLKFVHRDLKPANILFNELGTPKIADFGLALSFQTQHGIQDVVAGSVAYMAPEQLEGRKIDGRADLWSLGVIFYEMLVGHRPFAGKDSQSVIHQIIHDEARPIRQSKTNIPQGIANTCHRLLAKSPAQRLETAMDVVTALREHLANETHPVGSQPHEVGRESEAKPNLTIVYVLVSTILITLLATLVFSQAFRSNSGRGDVESLRRPAWADPDVLAWAPNNDQIDSYKYDPDEERFKFDTFGEALFAVGKSSSDKLTLRIQFRVHGNDGVGQAGVFWAYAPVYGDDRIDSCCWSVKLGRGHSIGPYILDIYQQDLGFSGGRHVVLAASSVMVLPITQPTADVVTLEVTANQNEILGVLLNGEPILKSPVPLESTFCREWRTTRGAYGIFGQHGSFSVEEFSIE
jgi:serine/threonine protein kinase